MVMERKRMTTMKTLKMRKMMVRMKMRKKVVRTRKKVARIWRKTSNTTKLR